MTEAFTVPRGTVRMRGKHERHQHDASTGGEHVPGAAQIEPADAADRQIGDYEVEETPQNIDRRLRQAFSEWR